MPGEKHWQNLNVLAEHAGAAHKTRPEAGRGRAGQGRAGRGKAGQGMAGREHALIDECQIRFLFLYKTFLFKKTDSIIQFHPEIVVRGNLFY